MDNRLTSDPYDSLEPSDQESFIHGCRGAIILLAEDGNLC